MGQPANRPEDEFAEEQEQSEKTTTVQKVRDAHYQEDGVTAEHAREGAQYGRESKKFKPNDGADEDKS